MTKKRSNYFAFTLLLFIGSHMETSAQIMIVSASCENKINPLGVGISNLHFSWKLSSKEKARWQQSYQFVCSSSMINIGSGKYDLANSGVVPGDQSIMVAYPGKKLRPGTCYYWRVRVWDDRGRPSAWSGINHFTTGLIQQEDWSGAKWIGYENMDDTMRVAPGVHYPDADKLGNKCMQRPVVPLFRKAFHLTKKIKKAIVFVSGLGQYELSINGAKIGNGFLTPGWTYYDKRCLYNVFDVTPFINTGDNAIGAIVGNGFYNINRERYFKMVDAFGYPKIICCLQIQFEDGSVSNIVSDSSWKTSPSPITFSSIYGGEDYDARLEQQGWNEVNFADENWKNVLLVKPPGGRLVAEIDYPVTISDSFAVKNISEPVPGVYLYDFGQNASGTVEIKVKGKKGQVIRLIPSELVDAHGLNNQLAVSESMDKLYSLSYTLKGVGEEVWRPRFTYYGFRYMQVDGAGELNHYAEPSLPCIIEMKFLHNQNSAPANGSFHCANDLYNQVYTLINWAIKSNRQSIITDCPHREKLGWLEEVYLMGSSVNYNFDSYHLYKKIVQDILDAQTKGGLVPDIAPEFVPFEGGFRDSPEWGSASVILPWLIYTWYGDKQLIEEAYPMMKKYVSYLESRSAHHILSHGLGDWYDYGPGPPGDAQLTPKALTATAIYFYDVQLLGKMATLLHQGVDAEKYGRLSARIKLDFNAAFFDRRNKVYSTGSQTAMAMPLSLGLVEDKYKKEVLHNLVDSIRQNGKALTAGDIGFHFLVKVLDEGGASDLVDEMNNRSDVPGYGFQLKKGATALTESWNASTESSNNHLMLGHIMEWFYNGLAGISQDEHSVAYKHIIIRPQPVGSVNSAEGSFESPYGTITSEWKKSGDGFSLHIHIPVNSVATVYLPVTTESKIYVDNILQDKHKVKISGGVVMIPVRSGEYKFSIK